MSRGSQEGTVQSVRRRGSQADERGMTMLDICAATTFKSGGHGVTPACSLSIPHLSPLVRRFSINTGPCQLIVSVYFYPS